MSIHTDSVNELLARLTDTESERLHALMQPVGLDFKQVLYGGGAPIESVYFPHRTIVSALTTMQDGSTIEVATIGREGMVGLSVLHGERTSANEVVVQVAGDAHRMDADVFEREIATRDSSLRQLLRLYQAAFRTQISYSVVCNMLHSLQQRCCRWLLTTSDRIGADELPLTHEFLGMMLRVRRASVAEVLRPLNDLGLVRSRRGSILILDRGGMEKLACPCYRNVKDGFRRLLR